MVFTIERFHCIQDSQLGPMVFTIERFHCILLGDGQHFARPSKSCRYVYGALLKNRPFPRGLTFLWTGIYAHTQYLCKGDHAVAGHLHGVSLKH